MAFVQTGVKDFLHTHAAFERTPAADVSSQRALGYRSLLATTKIGASQIMRFRGVYPSEAGVNAGNRQTGDADIGLKAVAGRHVDQ